MRKINEIFYSLQGEGHFTGTPVVFIRFSGCNLTCDFCDTQHQTGTFMEDDVLLQKINKYPSRHVVLTGGEPSLFIDAAFIHQLKSAGWFIQVETNGTGALPAGIDWVTCSPKYNSHPVILNPDELKVVYTGQDMKIYEHFQAKVYYLQPCSGQNTKDVIEYILQHPDWKLSLQTHKILDIR